MLLQVTHKFSAQVQDGVLVGGRFLTATGDKFCVAAYDSCDVICYCAWLLFVDCPTVLEYAATLHSTLHIWPVQY